MKLSYSRIAETFQPDREIPFVVVWYFPGLKYTIFRSFHFSFYRYLSQSIIIFDYQWSIIIYINIAMTGLKKMINDMVVIQWSVAYIFRSFLSRIASLGKSVRRKVRHIRTNCIPSLEKPLCGTFPYLVTTDSRFSASEKYLYSLSSSMAISVFFL